MRPSTLPCALALVSALSLSPSCSSDRSPRSCGSAADCPAGADCVLGACVAGGLPTASIALRTGDLLYTHRALVFDGSASTDPNPGHGLVAYRWAVQRGAGAHCDPTPASGAGPQLSTVFTCEGDYEVTLTVADDLGLESAPATLAVSVLRSANPPEIVEVGPELTLGHRCAGAPLACTVVAEDGADRFRLRVVATDVESGRALAYAWSYAAPPGVDPAQVSVTFDPDVHASAPYVRIASGGAAIAGAWTFTVTVTDADGLSTPATQRAVVTNAPPVLTPAREVIQSPHAYQAGGRLYVASDTVQATVVDPEGDPLSGELQLEEDAPSGCAFQVTQVAIAEGRYAGGFALTAVPGQEAPFLGTPRRLVAVVRDAAGAAARVTLPFEVLNRAPVLAWDPAAPRGATGGLAVPHRYRAPCGDRAACYEAAGASPLLATDPDGDPVVAAALAPSGAPDGLAVTVSGQGFTLLAEPAAAAALRGADGRAAVTFTAVARDPWTASAPAGFGVDVQNHPPLPARALDGSANLAWTGDRYVAEADVATFVDEDGDPLHAGAASGDALCGTFEVRGGTGHVACVLARTLDTPAAPDLSTLVGAHAVRLAAADAWEQGTAIGSRITVRDDHAPANAGGSITVQACTCGTQVNACGERHYTMGNVAPAAQLPISDADGTPVYVTIQSTCAVPSPAQLAGTGKPTFALVLTNCWNGTTLTVQASDGFLAHTAAYAVYATCSLSGQICGYGPRPPGSQCP